MYEQFFGFSRSGLSQRPFTATPSPNCFVVTSAIEETFSEVKQCLAEGRGIALLTAPAGMGKTLFCRKLMEEMASDFQTAFLANAQFPTRRSFLQTILYELGHGYIRMGEEEVRIILKKLLSTLRSPQSAVLLIIDEADHLSRRMFDEVRALSNLIDGENPLVRILLCGPLALEEQLALPENSACYQRVACQATLEPLTIQESVNYIDYRIQRVGSNLEQTFHPDGLEAICQASDGSPRAINQLCDHSLMLGYLAEQSPVDLPTVLEALDDLKQLPLCWNEPAAAKATYNKTETAEESDIEEAYKLELSSAEDFHAITKQNLDSEQDPHMEEASFEVGSIEVGANCQIESPVETSQAEEKLTISPGVFEEGAEEEIPSFEIGAEVMSVQEAIIPLAVDSAEPELLFIEKREEVIAPEAETEEVNDSQEEVIGEEPAVEIVFDRYALIDTGDPLTENCINLTDAISESVHIKQHNIETASSDQISDDEEISDVEQAVETGTLKVEAVETDLQQKDEIRINLIQVCQETRQAVGHQLNVLEEIWETSHNNETTENGQNSESKTCQLETPCEETLTPIRLDLFPADAEAEENQTTEPEEQRTTTDLTAMRQRLSQRFKQLRRKHG